MEPSCVRQTLIPGTSKLYADYLYNYEQVSSFFPSHFSDLDSLVEAGRTLEFPASRREQLIQALASQNHNSAALAKLAEPGTVAVVTGQQVGLLSGPVYTIYKALTAVRLARELSSRGVPAVPVFWFATEDHDLAEVDHAFVFNQQASPSRISVKSSCLQNIPVGSVSIDDFPADALAQSLGDLPHASDVLRLVKRHYGGSTTYGKAFAGLVKELLGEFDLIYLDPLQPQIRALAAPLLSEAAGRVPELTGALRRRNTELEAAGYHAQVHIDSASSLLFLLEDGRRAPLKFRDGSFALKDRTYSTADLCALSHWISPNALLRPVMQDYLLPTVSYVAGPAEIAYFAQSEVLYKKLLGRMPVIYPRNSFTLLDGRAEKLLGRYNIRVENLLDAPDHVRAKIAEKVVPVDLRSDLAALRSEISAKLGNVREKLVAFDPTLAAAADKSMAKIRYQVDKLSAKTARETMRHDSYANADTDYLLNFLYPQRHLQERYYSVIPMLAKFGLDLPERLYNFVQLSCPDHMLRHP